MTDFSSSGIPPREMTPRDGPPNKTPSALLAMDKVFSGYVTGLPGIHAMYGGTEFRWRRPIRERKKFSSRTRVGRLWLR